jgi:heptosyltransferase I
VKLGFDWRRSRELLYLTTNRHIPPRAMRHVQDQFFEFIDYLDIRNYPVQWNFKFTTDELAWKTRFFADIKRPVIGFVIASAHPEKDWPAAYYAKVMDDLNQRLNLQPMVIGGPSERERRIADEILSLCRCRPTVALEKPIRHTMLQLAGCRLVVAPDTGPLHISVALDIPTIGLYGYSNPKRCGPYKFQDLLIDKYNVDEPEEAPITRKTKPGRMQTIDPEMVIEKIKIGLAAYPAIGRDGDNAK